MTSVTKGEFIFKQRCAQCHTITKNGPNKQGPNLWGVFGRKAGVVKEFHYSEDFKKSGVVWNEQTLFAYILNPKSVIPTTKMGAFSFIHESDDEFPGIRNEQNRRDLVAYLRAQS